MVKTFIERNTVQGTVDFASELQRALDKEARRSAEERGQAVPTLPGKILRESPRRRIFSKSSGAIF